MRGSAQVTVRGADRLAATMRQAAKSLEDLSPANTVVSAAVARAAQANAPRRTGTLARSIQPAATADSAAVTAGVGIRYAGVIEGGWRAHGIEPSRYMARATEAQIDPAVDTYVDAAQDAVDQIRGI